MSNVLTIKFSNESTVANLWLLDKKLGMFTLAEKLLEQIAELYEDKVICYEELVDHISDYFENSLMKSNLVGRFSIFYTIYQLFPEVPFTLNEELSEQLSLAMIKEDAQYVFTTPGKEVGEHLTLSPYFRYQYQAFSFLNFLFYTNCISLEKGKIFEETISNSLMYQGEKLEILN